jgi:hypothetical protein
MVEWWMESEKQFRDNVLFWVHKDQGGLDAVTYGQIGRRIANARGGAGLPFLPG